MDFGFIRPLFGGFWRNGAFEGTGRFAQGTERGQDAGFVQDLPAVVADQVGEVGVQRLLADTNRLQTFRLQRSGFRIEFPSPDKPLSQFRVIPHIRQNCDFLDIFAQSRHFPVRHEHLRLPSM